MALLPKNKIPHGRQAITAALDVGTTKITCLIAQVNENGDAPQPDIRVMGIGHKGARGIKAGVVTDMEAAEDAIRACLGQAEQMAGVTIHRAWLNVSSTTLQSRILNEQLMLANGEVGPGEMRRVLRDARARAYSGARETLHAIPVGFSVDGSKGIKDPNGMLGDVLAVNMNEVSMEPGPFRNLGVCVQRCHLEPEGPVYSAYASGLAALVEDEMALGVTVVELGGGTTSLASFYEGNMVFGRTFGIGGVHVTQDIARGLSTPLADAERMKVLYGSVMASPNDDREMIDVPPIGEEGIGVANHVARSMLVGIVKPRIEETFEFIRDALRKSGVERVAGHRLVLTGGACQLNGLREFAGRFFDAHVRTGRPLGLSGLPEAAAGPAFATAGGLLTYVYRAPYEAPRPAGARTALSGLLGVIGLGRRAKVA